MYLGILKTFIKDWFEPMSFTMYFVSKSTFIEFIYLSLLLIYLPDAIALNIRDKELRNDSEWS